MVVIVRDALRICHVADLQHRKKWPCRQNLPRVADITQFMKKPKLMIYFAHVGTKVDTKIFYKIDDYLFDFREFFIFRVMHIFTKLMIFYLTSVSLSCIRARPFIYIRTEFFTKLINGG